MSQLNLRIDRNVERIHFKCYLVYSVLACSQQSNLVLCQGSIAQSSMHGDTQMIKKRTIILGLIPKDQERVF